MDIIFEHKQGTVTKIYACSFFTPHLDEKLKGKNLEVSFIKLNEIDEDNDDMDGEI